MKVLVAAAVVLACSGAQAQVYKCQESGKTVYSQAPCPAGGRLLDSTRAPEPTDAPRSVRRPAYDAGPSLPIAAPAPEAQAQARQCPSEQDVRNMEAANTSIRLDQDERLVRMEQVRRARACEPLMSEVEMALMKQQLRAQRRAGHPSPAPAPSVLPTESWSRDGRRCSTFGGVTDCR